MIYINLLFIIIFVLIFIKNFSGSNRNETVLKIRENQINLRDNKYKKKLEKMLNEKSKITKKISVELLCKQAGYDYTYGEFIICSILTAIIFPAVLLMITFNKPLAIIVCFLGYNFPKFILNNKCRKRKLLMERQVGSFLDIITERYKHNPDLNANIIESIDSFKGQEPFYSELFKVVKLIQYAGYSPLMALDELINASGNKYLRQFKDSYQICQTLPSDDSRIVILEQSRIMYDTDRKLTDEMREKLNGPVSTSYIVVGFVPAVMIYQCFMNEGYIDMLLNSSVGKWGLTFIVCLVLGTIWIIENKINAPLSDSD